MNGAAKEGGMMEKKRSVGITVLGILSILFGVINLLISILIFGSVSIYYLLFAIAWSLLVIPWQAQRSCASCLSVISPDVKSRIVEKPQMMLLTKNFLPLDS